MLREIGDRLCAFNVMGRRDVVRLVTHGLLRRPRADLAIQQSRDSFAEVTRSDVFLPPSRKDQLFYSRSFSKKITELRDMEQVVSLYAQRVSARIRAQQQVVGHVRVWACPRLVFSRIMPTRSCAIAPMKLRTARPIGVDGSTFNADSVRLWIAPSSNRV